VTPHQLALNHGGTRYTTITATTTSQTIVMGKNTFHPSRMIWS
jgi:hypothetical protein